MNSGAFFAEDDDVDEESFLLLNGKKIYDIIFRKAVLLHETNQKCDFSIRKQTIDDILKLFPTLEEDYPRLFTQFCSCLDRITKRKGAISTLIYSQIVDDLKEEKIL